MTTVLFLHRGGDHIRGTEACLIQSVRALTADGYEAVVVRNHPCIDRAIAEITPNPRIIPFEFPELTLSGKHTSLPIFRFVRQLQALKKLIGAFEPAVLYCSGGLPCQLAVTAAPRKRVRVLCHFHHPAMKRDYYFWRVTSADRIIFPSEYTRDHSRAKANVQGTVIYNGVDLNRFTPVNGRDMAWRTKYGIASDAIVIGQVGALTQHKRPEFLIRSFAALVNRTRRRLHLCIVGTGELESRVSSLARDLNLIDRVTLTGYVDDTLPFYQHVFDINVLVSEQEGLGISAIEGSACGLPVVASNCTGLRETIRDNITGMLFDPTDSESFEAKLLSLVEQPELRQRLGVAGATFARERFSSEEYDKGIVMVVRELCDAI